MSASDSESKLMSTSVLASFNSLPIELLGKIVNNVDFRSLLTLRKVNTMFRDFIDYEKPDNNAKELVLAVDSRGISCEIFFDEDDGNAIWIEYHKSDSGCIVNVDGEEKCVEGKDFFTVFKEDSKMIWRHSKSKLTRLHIEYVQQFNYFDNHRFSKDIGSELQFLRNQRSTPMQVETLIMETYAAFNIMQILPHLDSSVLKNIVLRATEEPSQNRADDIIATEQWAHATTFSGIKFVSAAPIQHFLHFDKLRITLQSISGTDVVTLKNAIVHSTSFDSYKIKYHDFVNFELLLNLFIHFPYTSDASLKFITTMENEADTDTEEEENDLRQLREYERLRAVYLRNGNADNGDEREENDEVREEEIVQEEENNDSDSDESEFDPDDFIHNRFSSTIWYFRMEHDMTKLLVIKNFGHKDSLHFQLCNIDEKPLSATINR